MKKIILIMVVLVILVGGVGAGVYFGGLVPSGLLKSLTVSAPAPQPLPVTEVQPGVSFAGLALAVPDMNGVTTTLDLLSPTSRRDYPMGRFKDVDSGAVGNLVMYDEYATTYENGLRAVPISVSTTTGAQLFYLAVLTGEDMKQATTVPLGTNIKIMGVARAGSQATVTYLIHDRDQQFEETPRITTATIVDIVKGSVLQAGRNPAAETIIVIKNFAPKYRWVETVADDGSKTIPSIPDKFFLIFDANRVTFQTDCNTGGATFTSGTGSSTAFVVDAIATTKMFCSSSEEGPYFAMFEKVKTYNLKPDGTLTLKFSGSGAMTFAPVIQKTETDSTPETDTATTS